MDEVNGHNKSLDAQDGFGGPRQMRAGPTSGACPARFRISIPHCTEPSASRTGTRSACNRCDVTAYSKRSLLPPNTAVQRASRSLGDPLGRTARIGRPLWAGDQPKRAIEYKNGVGLPQEWGAAYVPKKTTAAKLAVIPANEKPTERVMPANTSTTPAVEQSDRQNRVESRHVDSPHMIGEMPVNKAQL